VKIDAGVANPSRSQCAFLELTGGKLPKKFTTPKHHNIEGRTSETNALNHTLAPRADEKCTRVPRPGAVDTFVTEGKTYDVIGERVRKTLILQFGSILTVADRGK
jgi:hypothetical protein